MHPAPEYALAIRTAATLLRIFGGILPDFEAQMRAQLVAAFAPVWGEAEAERFADAVLAEAKALCNNQQQ